jgi:hypothetical protein
MPRINKSISLSERLINKIASKFNQIKLKELNIIDLNERLISNIDSKKVFSAVRLGNTENIIFNKLLNKRKIDQYLVDLLCDLAGFYPKNILNITNEFYLKYLESLKYIDFLGSAGSYYYSSKFLKIYKNDIFTNNKYLDPIYLYKKDDPWTSRLKDKNVVFISSHYQSMNLQKNRLNKVWGKKVKSIMPFKSISLIKSPNFSLGDKNLKKLNWFEVPEYLVNQVLNLNNIDFAFIGSGAYSPIISTKLKQKGISSITTCGATQLFFGIMGERWQQRGFKEHQKLFNKFWIKPLNSDRPKKYNEIKYFEGNTSYW